MKTRKNTDISDTNADSGAAIVAAPVRAVRCLVCGDTFVSRKDHRSLSTIIAHCQTEHPDECRQIMKHNERIKTRIRGLEGQLKHLWEETHVQLADTEINEGRMTR